MKNYLNYIAALAFFLMLLASCKKEYYQDGGTHNPNFDGTAMDFLESRKDLFDTLTQIVKLAGFENVLRNEEITFFAAPDPAIGKTLRGLNRFLYLSGQDTVKELDQIDPVVWRFFVSKYILKGKSVLKDFPQLDTTNMQAFPGQGYYTYDNEPMHIGVIFNDIKTKNADGVEQIVKYAGYRQLYFSDFGGFSISGLTVGPVATSDIQPTNGVVHVLQYSKHNFGFNSEDFILRAYNRGIKPPKN
ncbi:hypothetical protein [Sphingobacterium suaedae]|uniref:FAS1 domain-containing protein n=1 Tax=Sphingobacterium suaedae TaxID=1686402 RepID=A0ABW5KMR0_9SPHI